MRLLGSLYYRSDETALKEKFCNELDQLCGRYEVEPSIAEHPKDGQCDNCGALTETPYEVSCLIGDKAQFDQLCLACWSKYDKEQTKAEADIFLTYKGGRK